MIELNEFLLKSSIILIVFYAGYWFLLRKTTHFKLNRFYLLSGLLLSLSLPFMHFSIPEEYPTQVFITLDSIEVTAVNTQADAQQFDYAGILKYIYFSIALLLVFRLIFQFYLIFRLYLSSEKEKIDKKIVLKTDKNNAAFSFFNLVFISDKDRNSDEFYAIFRHESVHVSQKHSVDILFAEILVIVLWFNPFAWLYLKSIKANHEFLADDGVVRYGFSASRYLEILFEQSTGLHLSLANNFNQSLTFKRLNMMKKIRSNKLTQLKVLIALPVIIAMVIFVSCSKELIDVRAEKNEEVKQFDTQGINAHENNVDDEVFYIVEEMPQFPGGELGLRKFIAMNVKYPQEARENNVQGKVFVRFIITKTGDVDSVTVVRSVDPVLDNEAARVIKALPKWTPGKQKEIPVNVYYTLPINFKLDNRTDNQTVTVVDIPDDNTKHSPDVSAVTVVAMGTQSVKQTDEDMDVTKIHNLETPTETFFIVEKMPEFPDGKTGLKSFLAENLKYPEEAEKNKIEGKTYIRFRVTTNGGVDKVSVAKTCGNKLLDEEAMRVVKLTNGQWTAGEQRGAKVNVWFTVPIQFSLK
jgi:TonB family protein